MSSVTPILYYGTEISLKLFTKFKKNLLKDFKDARKGFSLL